MPGSSEDAAPERGPIAQLLREAREAASLSQEELAEATGYSRGYISLIETGDRIPSESFARRALTVLPIEPGPLLTLLGKLPRDPRRRLAHSGPKPQQQQLNITSLQFVPLLRDEARKVESRSEPISHQQVEWRKEIATNFLLPQADQTLSDGDRTESPPSTMEVRLDSATMHLSTAGVDVLCVKDQINTDRLADVAAWQVQSYRDRLTQLAGLPSYVREGQYIFSVYVIQDAHHLPWTFSRIRSALAILAGPLLVWATSDSETFSGPFSGSDDLELRGLSEARRLEDQLLREGVTERLTDALGLVEFGVPEIALGVAGWGAIAYAAMSPAYAQLQRSGTKGAGGTNRSYADEDVQSLIELEIRLQALWRLTHAALNDRVPITKSLVHDINLWRWELVAAPVWESVVDERMRNAAIVTSKIQDIVENLIAHADARGII